MIKYFKSLFTSAKPGHRKPKVLFLLKLRDKIPGYSYGSSGLYNSARFVNEMLRNHGFESCLEQVVDANSIDREVHKLKPDVVVIEAFWITPAKFKELKKLHPGVRWIVRNHSKPAFLAQEGSAFGWILEYFEQGIEVASNSYQGVEGLASLAESRGLDRELSTYLPNYYPLNPEILDPQDRARPKSVNIGCFGAIRPLKNHVNQALAAIEFADRQQLTLHFHVNAGRIEHGDSVLKSLKAIFAGGPHVLVQHPWYDHTQFLAVVANMDVVTQVSHSESFCIVAADAVSEDVPVVGSPELEWLQGFPKADPDVLASIVSAYEDVWLSGPLKYVRSLRTQRKALTRFNRDSVKAWKNLLCPKT